MPASSNRPAEIITSCSAAILAKLTHGPAVEAFGRLSAELERLTKPGIVVLRGMIREESPERDSSWKRTN